LVCDTIEVISPGPFDVPNVVTDGIDRVQICGSTRWKRLRDLPGVFTCIVSHESLHLVLAKIEGRAAEELDNFASLSAISRSLKDIPRCVRYPHGLIGFD
jgi:hypothetical protein